MKAPNYPYPTMDDDGYELQLLDESLPEVAPDSERFAAQAGDTVKLIFSYKEPVRNQGIYGSERMWVEVLERGEVCLVGRLDSAPSSQTFSSPTPGFSSTPNTSSLFGLHPNDA